MRKFLFDIRKESGMQLWISVLVCVCVKLSLTTQTCREV